MNQRIKHISTILTAIVLIATVLSSCDYMKTKEENMSQRQILVEVGDSALYLDEVLARIPVGIAADDSIAMFSSIVDSWIENLLLTEVATESAIDLERIDRLTANYRKQLIMSEFRKSGKKETSKRVTDEKIRDYYSVNGDQMILEQPLIKGIYMKVSDKASNIEELEHLMSHPTKENVDRLEKDGFPEALQYEYFTDKWVAWESISSQIPYRFFDADAFLESTKDFTTSYNGSTYMLHISEYMPTGEKIPYDFARDEIRDILTREESAAYDKRVLESFYKRAVKEGKLKMVGYDALTHQMKQ